MYMTLPRIQVNQANARRLALHVLLTGAGAAVGALTDAVLHSSNPATVGIGGLIGNYLAAFLRYEDAVVQATPDVPPVPVFPTAPIIAEAAKVAEQAAQNPPAQQ